MLNLNQTKNLFKTKNSVKNNHKKTKPKNLQILKKPQKR